MKKYLILTAIISVTVLFRYNPVYAGAANLTIVHEKPDIKVVKYIIKYGKSEKANPEEYPFTKEIIPAGSGLVQSVTLTDLGNGTSGEYYFAVKDIYKDGSESEFSESSFPITIPEKPVNLQISE